MPQFIAMILRILGLGAVLSMMSELWYYPVDLKPETLTICLFYGPIAYVAWLVAAQTRIRTWVGAIWAAFLMGFLVESIPVPFFFSALPFTIVWTSMAWHGLISVTLGLWAFRYLAAHRSSLTLAVFCLGLGAYFGLATVELWTIPTDDAVWTWVSLEELALQWMGAATWPNGPACNPPLPDPRSAQNGACWRDADRRICGVAAADLARALLVRQHAPLFDPTTGEG